MDAYCTERRAALLFGLRREDVRGIAREKEGGCYHALALLLPGECRAIAEELAEAINDAVNSEAGFGNEALFDLWGARHFRFLMQARWYEKLMVAYFPQLVERKYAHLTRMIAFMGQAGEGEVSVAGEGQCAVVIVTSYRKDGRDFLRWQHDACRTREVLEALEAHEERLRTIIRRAAPSHHLLAAPVAKPDEDVSGNSQREEKKPVPTRFQFSPVFVDTPASMNISV